jgi:hypothetical protein
VKTYVTRTATVVLAALSVLVATACSPTVTDGPGQVAVQFAKALGRHDLAAAAKTTTSPGLAEPALRAAFNGLQATGVEVKIGQVRTTGDASVVDYEYRWRLPKDSTGAARQWRYDGTFSVLRNSGSWQVRWDPTALNPRLGANQQMVLKSVPAPSAPVNSASGGTLMNTGVITRIRLQASAVPQSTSVLAVATQLAQVLAPVVPHLDPVKITEQATSSSQPYEIATLNETDMRRVGAGLTAIPGLIQVPQADLLPTDPTFAPALVANIKKQVGNQIQGVNGWQVVAQADTGAQVGVLTEVDPQPKPAITVSISPTAQAAAQAAVNSRTDKQTMMVVISASTGHVLAVAQNPVADKQGSLATSGLYPPGSTGKIITGTAALDTGIATPQTIVPCDGTITIGDRTIPNYDTFSLGDVPMSRAFAESCNTSFAYLGSKLAPDQLKKTASGLGVGLTYDIAGLPVATANYPVANDLTLRVEDSFGQGQVLVTPFAMALAAATVDHGGPVVPVMMLGTATKVTGERTDPSPQAIDGMRQMMRDVVVEGTAELIKGIGDVYGKTGEAEFNGGSHAWFVGYRGDLAFATLIVGGGDSNNAVAVTKDFFEQYDQQTQ